jgi:uncharacterized protein (TIGR03435 family)
MKQLVLAVLLASAPFAPAQSTDPRPQVDVAAIRLTAPGAGDLGGVSITPGRFTVQALSLQRLIYIAYKIKADQIQGGPSWVNSDRYDISATADDVTGDKFPQLLQTLLEDRFHLKVHRDTKEGSVYDLIVAKTGLKMQPSKQGGCIPLDLSKDRSQPVPGQQVCGMWRRSRAGYRNGTGITMTDQAGVGFQSLTGQLSLVLDRPVIDKSGLSGLYDVHLEWTPDDANTASDKAPSAASDATGPSIFTAIREQLGLELKPAKGPVPVLVIDSAERPSEN